MRHSKIKHSQLADNLGKKSHTGDSYVQLPSQLPISWVSAPHTQRRGCEAGTVRGGDSCADIGLTWESRARKSLSYRAEGKRLGGLSEVQPKPLLLTNLSLWSRTLVAPGPEGFLSREIHVV